MHNTKESNSISLYTTSLFTSDMYGFEFEELHSQQIATEINKLVEEVLQNMQPTQKIKEDFF